MDNNLTLLKVDISCHFVRGWMLLVLELGMSGRENDMVGVVIFGSVLIHDLIIPLTHVLYVLHYYYLHSGQVFKYGGSHIGISISCD